MSNVSFAEGRATPASPDATLSAGQLAGRSGRELSRSRCRLEPAIARRGVGLSVASPWGNGASAATLGVGAALWLVVVQWLSSAFGGYLTGRLRTKWQGVHTHEVFFRDTANGFLVWALATVVTVPCWPA